MCTHDILRRRMHTIYFQFHPRSVGRSIAPSTTSQHFGVETKIMQQQLPKIDIPCAKHCTSLRFGVHRPALLHVLVIGMSEGNSPSLHWKVTIAPSVVLDTLLITPLEGNSGWPQSTIV